MSGSCWVTAAILWKTAALGFILSKQLNAAILISVDSDGLLNTVIRVGITMFGWVLPILVKEYVASNRLSFVTFCPTCVVKAPETYGINSAIMSLCLRAPRATRYTFRSLALRAEASPPRRYGIHSSFTILLLTLQNSPVTKIGYDTFRSPETHACSNS